MRITILTIFPELFRPFLAESILGRALEAGRLEVSVRDLRDWTLDRHQVVDDEPYGGGGGMVMKAEPWLRAVEEVTAPGAWRVLLSPQGEVLDEARVRALAERPELVLLCGRYEGIDERVRELVVDQEISIGDYVVAGGEVPAMVLVEAVSRQIAGVVGLPSSVERDSFRRGLLDFPHYTRPREVRGLGVPEVLLSGDHAAIEAWRRRQALERTLARRPDLLASAQLDAEEQRELERLRAAAAEAAEAAALAPAEDSKDNRRSRGSG